MKDEGLTDKQIRALQTLAQIEESREAADAVIDAFREVWEQWRKDVQRVSEALTKALEAAREYQEKKDAEESRD